MGILFLTNYYYPKPMANGVCIHQLAKEYVRRGEQAHVICWQQPDENKCEVIDGVNVYRIRLPFYRNCDIYSEIHRKTFLGRCAGKYGRLIGCIRKLLHIKQYPLRDSDIVRRYVQSASGIIKNNMISKLVAPYNPLEAIKAGEILKKKYPKLNAVYYSVDTLSNERGYGILPESYRTRAGLQREKYYFSVYDHVIIMNCHKEHYTQDVFAEFKGKTSFADFPLFERYIQSSDTTGKNNRIVYTGYLHKSMRNPRPALEFLRPVLNEYVIHFYVRGNCDYIIDEYRNEFPDNIVNHGFVPHDEAQHAIRNADVLLSIGNAETTMAPSKIYEYVSTGKPIIHVYTYDYDPCLQVLNMYGNALCLKADDVKSADKITQFLNKIHTVPAEALKNIFEESTAVYTVNLINSCIVWSV